MINNFLALLIAYALGCFATGYYLVRWRKGIDIRAIGNHRIGAWNVTRVLGTWGTAVTALGDAGKGALAVLIARWLGADEGWQAAAMIAAMLGHNFPIQLGFRGGNGLATACGAAIALAWPLFLFLLLMAIALTPTLQWAKKVTGWPLPYYLPSQLMLVLSPFTAWWMGYAWSLVGALALAAIIILASLRANLRSLQQTGAQENPFARGSTTKHERPPTPDQTNH